MTKALLAATSVCLRRFTFSPFDLLNPMVISLRLSTVGRYVNKHGGTLDSINKKNA